MKKRLRIGIIDLVFKGPTKALYARVMHANYAGIMPQTIGVWCEQEGHDVTLLCYTGLEDVSKELPKDVDLVFIGAFTQSAQTAYALSNMFRAQGAVTVLGGPHARCFPQDSVKYFDYVLGFTDKQIIRDVLQDCSQHRPVGIEMKAKRQPATLPSLRERWSFVEPTMKKAPFFKVAPMIGSMGCPYTCAFCIDSVVDYQPLAFEMMKEDLKFLLTKFKNPVVGWHDPNFGIRFDETMSAIEEAVPPGRMMHIAENSLSLLNEKNLKRLKKNGFKALLPGIESWYDLGGKSKTGRRQGEEKLARIADQINMIHEYVPYTQTNFVFGLDTDEGPDPFELTKKYVDLVPATFPGISLLSSYGQAAPMNLTYMREGRVIPFPFHFMNNNLAMNVKPKNYSWPEFYDLLIDVTKHTWSNKAIYRRFRANSSWVSKWMNVVRAISSEGYGRLRHFAKIRTLLDEDRQFRGFFEGEHTEIPPFFIHLMKQGLGNLWEWLPEGAIEHDPNAYLKAEEAKAAKKAAKEKEKAA